MTPNARSTYLDASIATASPARLLVMLLDRLVLDTRRGLAALEAAQPYEAHLQLTHAQDIVHELSATLRPDAFVGGRELAALYDYLLRRLVEANFRKDPGAAAECADLAGELAATWREAALASVTARSA